MTCVSVMNLGKYQHKERNVETYVYIACSKRNEKCIQNSGCKTGRDGKGQLVELGVDAKMILRLILGKEGVRICSRFSRYAVVNTVMNIHTAHGIARVAVQQADAQGLPWHECLTT